MTTETENKEKKNKLNIKQIKAQIPVIIGHVKLIFDLIRPFTRILIVNYILNLVQTGLGMVQPQFTGGIIDIVTRSKDSEDLKYLAIRMLIFTMVNQEVNKLSGRFSNKYYNTLQRDLKSAIYGRLLECDMEFFDKLSSTEATQIISSGVDQLIQLSFYSVTSTLQTIATLVGNLYLMYLTSPRLTLVILISTPIKFFLNFVNWNKQNKIYKEIHEIYRDVYDIPNQVLQNIGLIKGFSTEKKETIKFQGLQKQLGKAEGQLNNDHWFLSFLKAFFQEALNTIVIWMGGAMVFEGSITAGSLSTFTMYSSQFEGSIHSTRYVFQNLYRGAQQSGKLLNVLKVNSTSKAKTSKNIIKPNLKGSISIEQVSFSYPAKPDVEVLTNINLQINAGEATAFVGVSGSGKTTLTYLLQNLYTPNQGRIFVDGEDIRDYDIKWLHGHMGYVSQEPILLDRSIEENLVYGIEGEYTQEHVENTLAKSNSKFILNKEKFPKGLASKLGSGEGRTKLSGGQKQRIAIGRAFAKDPKILILDEPTSALDGESESQVQKAIDDLTSLGDRTVIVIAHRLSTIINCQKIVVFEDGKVVEQGTHKELLAKNGAYSKLFEFQLESMRKL